jgi:hypothetical protein
LWQHDTPFVNPVGNPPFTLSFKLSSLDSAAATSASVFRIVELNNSIAIAIIEIQHNPAIFIFFDSWAIRLIYKKDQNKINI